jgi:prevent-host-death family protein
MKMMGIRDLKARMSEVIKEVQDGETIEVTNHGKVVALLVPPPPRLNREEIEASLDSVDRLAAEIGRHVTERTDVAQTISDMRR